MPHSYISCLLHIIFATAERKPLIRPEIQNRLHAYLGGIARENDMAALAVGGVADHVHVLLSLSRTIAVAKALQLLKGGSSKWLNENSPGKVFSWQEGPSRSASPIATRSPTIF